MNVKLTLLDTLKADRVFAVSDHSPHIPDGQSGHWSIIDLQKQLVLVQFTPVRFHLSNNGELSMLRASLQLEPKITTRTLG